MTQFRSKILQCIFKQGKKLDITPTSCCRCELLCIQIQKVQEITGGRLQRKPGVPATRNRNKKMKERKKERKNSTTMKKSEFHSNMHCSHTFPQRGSSSAGATPLQMHRVIGPLTSGQKRIIGEKSWPIEMRKHDQMKEMTLKSGGFT